MPIERDQITEFFIKYEEDFLALREPVNRIFSKSIELSLFRQTLDRATDEHYIKILHLMIRTNLTNRMNGYYPYEQAMHAGFLLNIRDNLIAATQERVFAATEYLRNTV